MANVFDTVSNGEDAVARQVQQILDVLLGATGGDIPLYLTEMNEASLVPLTIQNQNASGEALRIYASDGVTVLLEVGGSARPSVTGSRAGNAALASLLTALGATGLKLITDSSTA